MKNNMITMIRETLKYALCATFALSLCTIPTTTSAAVFTFNASIEAPISVHAFPTAGHTRLTWQAASGTSPVSYKVYSRLSNEPDYYPVGTATTNQFDTTYTFAGVNDTVTRLFVVSAVSAGGMESALSEPVMDNDTDGDGLTDVREADYSTSVTAADTDGDGLTDGQEAFIYHTNPLVVDTDSDGVGDYQEVINEIRESLPPFAVTDTATTTAGVSIEVSVLANDFGGIATSTLALTTEPLHGSATVSTSTGMLTYTPASTYSGTDTMHYRIANKNNVTSTGAVTITVLAGSSTATTTSITYASTTPITLDTTSFVRAAGNTVSVSHTIGGGNASTTDRLLMCGTSAQTSSGANVAATQVTYGSTPLTKASTYLAASTASTTPTELWYLSNAPVGTNTVTMTAPSTTATSALVCTSFSDFYWYVPGQPFTWIPNTNLASSSIATTTPPAATTTPPVTEPMSTSTVPITFATTTFARASSNTVSFVHTADVGTATTTHRLLMCGVAAHDASGANVSASQVTYGASALTKASPYSAAPTASTTPTELWYLEEVSPGTNTLTVTAPTTAVSTAAVCTSFFDFYWYIPGRVFGW